MNILAKYGLGLLAKITPVWNPLAAYQVIVKDSDQTHYIPVHYGDGEVWEVGVQVKPFVLGVDTLTILDARPCSGCGQSFFVPIHPADSEGRQWFESSIVPSGRTLAAILAEAVSHSLQYPDHGTNCVCMDNYIREVRAHANRAIPEYWTGAITAENVDEPMNWSAWREHNDAKARVSYILGLVARNL